MSTIKISADPLTAGHHGINQAEDSTNNNNNKEKKEEEWILRDKYGFVVEPELLQVEQEMLKWTTHYATILEQRRKVWSDFIAKKSPIQRSTALKALVRMGIPLEHRRMIWLVCCEAREKLKASPGYYQSIHDKYGNQESVATKQIELDVRRTFPGHPVFDNDEGIMKLRKVLVAYSWKNPKVGYCQSMNFITAMLLLFQDEEEAFWMLATIIEDLLPIEYYTQSMLASQVDQKVFEALIADKLPKIHNHFVSYRLSLPLISTQWYLCLFVNSLPSESTLRVWDVFFNEGSKILFRVGLAILKMHEKQILECQDAGAMFVILKELPLRTYDCETLMDVAFNHIGSFPMKRIQQLRKQFTPAVEKELGLLNEARWEAKLKNGS